jgi:NAD(P)-dependent dehydrogenase (short-subunit alcohol dehydrogenase family)
MNLSVFGLTDKIALVTGAGRGIGREIALSFAQAGADVIVTSRTFNEIADTAAEIKQMGRRALAISADVQDAGQVTNLVNKTLGEFARIDILVNNAGAGVVSSAMNMSIDTWEAQIRENLTSVFICSRIVGEVMVKQKTGNIINITSIAGIEAVPSFVAYGAAKAGVVNLTKTLAIELASHHIRVNAIAPGFIKTPLMIKVAPETSEFRQGQLKRIPLGRFGEPEDIALLAIFLASDASAYITGETIVASGGLTTHVFNFPGGWSGQG